MLTVENLRAGYGNSVVIDQLSFRCEPGEVVALVGRNGVGKTTLLRALFGQCDVTAGQVTLAGKPLARGKRTAPARGGMTLMPDDRGVFASLTIDENLRLAERQGYAPPIEVRELFPLLAQRGGEHAGNLSGGQQQQLGIARAMLAGEHVIVIDELSQGLQPSLAKASLAALRTIAAHGTTVIFVEQGPRYPLEYADRVLGMVKGEIVLDQTAAALRADPTAITDLLVIG